MDLRSSKYLEAPPPFLPSHEGVGVRKENPLVDSFLDPLCKLNLKETSDFVKSFPMSNNKDGAVTKRNVVEAPPTPGRPVFSFSCGNNGPKKSFPSKWDDAQKWLISGHDSPAHHHHLHGFVKSADFVPKNCSSSHGFMVKHQEKYHQTEVFSEKSRVTEEKVSKAISIIQAPKMVSLGHHHDSLARAFNDVLLKDKFTNELEPSFPKSKCMDMEPMKEGFLFGNSPMKDGDTAAFQSVDRRDIGTEMTPLGSSTTSRCATPLKSLSPPRHNTPANRSGPLALMDPSSSFDIGELQECHLAKLQQGSPFDPVASNWSSREEEEEDVSKSLRHFEMNNEFRKSISEPKACAWEEEEKTKCCLRYQREEAKIQAWVNLQNAKAEAQSRKLEVKIQKMRSKFEEKSMRRMTIVHRKADELRAAAQHEHIEQIQKANAQSKKTKNLHESLHFSGHGGSCGCFPCNTLHP